MRCRGFVVVVALRMAVGCAFAQSSHEGGIHIVPTVTVCDIVNNPLQFKGMMVQVRAQVWPMFPGHNGQFWMNQSSVLAATICRHPVQRNPATSGIPNAQLSRHPPHFRRAA